MQKLYCNLKNKINIKNLNELEKALYDIEKPLFVAKNEEGICYSDNGSLSVSEDAFELLGFAQAIPIQNLGDKSFSEEYGVDYQYIGGSMAYGISSADMVSEFAKNKMLAFLGTGGMSVPLVEENIKKIKQEIGDLPFGCNLIHMPSLSATENAIVDLYLKYGVNIIEASAFITMTPALVKYRAKGLKRLADGTVEERTKIIAKASRVEVAERYLSTPPEKIVAELLSNGEITEEEAELVKQLPLCWDLTAEADSGGHTDSRPAFALFSSFVAVRDRLQKKYTKKIRIGFGGGIGTPHAAASAFSMGAAYIVTGTVNHACIESGTSVEAKKMLALAEQADTAIAPSADLFDIGGKVQVLKSGTLFPMRANKLLAYYNAYGSLEEIPQKDIEQIENTIMRRPLKEVWEETEKFFSQRSPSQLEKAKQSPKYKMALVFRYYLGLASRWAINGDLDRKIDFQIWAGPAIGSFNEWSKGTFLEEPSERKVIPVAYNMLYGAAVIERINSLRHYGLELFGEINITPKRLEELR